MSNSIANAEFSIYRSTAPYRLDGRGSLAARSGYADCFARCMAKCDVNAATCRFECQAECSTSTSANCPPDQRTCWGISPHHRCCPANTSCCVYYERPSLRTVIACCAPGQQCCMYGGCYDPNSQQCLPSGISNCPPGLAPCGTTCCPPGEVCTLDGCSASDEVCLGRRCEPGQTCTPQGCCDRDRVASNGCCPRERVICDGKCCAPGETCRHTASGGFCLSSIQ
jgi:hypothetical protein